MRIPHQHRKVLACTLFPNGSALVPKVAIMGQCQSCQNGCLRIIRVWPFRARPGEPAGYTRQCPAEGAVSEPVVDHAQQGGRHGEEDDHRRRQHSGVDGGAQPQVDVETGDADPFEDLHHLDAAAHCDHQQGGDGGQRQVAGKQVVTGGSLVQGSGRVGRQGNPTRRVPKPRPLAGYLPASGLRGPIVGSAVFAVNRRRWFRCLGVAHGRVRFRLTSIQHAFGDDFRDRDLFDGVAHGANTSDEHRAIRLPESFHCMLCRTPALAGA